jgi:hypothetical protein
MEWSEMLTGRKKNFRPADPASSKRIEATPFFVSNAVACLF